MDRIELEIVAISHSVTQSHSYAVVLGEKNGVRRIPIVIGGYEAQAIALALDKMPPSRPMTHDLMHNTLMAFGINLDEIYIHKIEEGIFFSKLLCTNDDVTLEIDSRTSDAIALAIRFNAPIFTNEETISSAGLILDDPKKAAGKATSNAPSSTDTAYPANPLAKLSLKELEQKLYEVLEQEDYIQAAAIRDEINSRK